MKVPARPPETATNELFSTAEEFQRALEAASRLDGYPHWDAIRRRPPPEGLTREQLWAGISWDRKRHLRAVPGCIDATGRPFCYGFSSDDILESVVQVDQRAAGRISSDARGVLGEESKDRYVVSSLIEESIRSSQLEGAATTRKRAKELIRSGRKPRTRDEQMVLNNFAAMRTISGLRDREVTPETIFDLHHELTDGTLDDPSAAGRFRMSSESVQVVANDDGTLLHIPPPADTLPARMERFCDFANGKTTGSFIHPVIRAIILHFWMAYDHPFVDGNGRCARALFYWSMLHQGYWLCEFLSISSILRKQPARYARSFLYTETDANDLTYFLLYNLEVIDEAITSLFRYLDRKSRQSRSLERLLRRSDRFNHRQKDLLADALQHATRDYTFKSHQTAHNVVRQTARNDILDLVDAGLLQKRKRGRQWIFSPTPDLDRRLQDM